MNTYQGRPSKEAAPVHEQPAASSQGADAPVTRDLNQWYRWERLDKWTHALRGRPQEEWLNAPWKTKLWWFRQDFLGTPIKHCAKCYEVTREFGAVVARQYGI